MLLNKERAYAVMDQNGLDGLVAQLPINVYYLTDYWSDVMEAGFDATCFAVFPRHEDAPAALVVMALQSRHVVTAGTWVPNVVTYTGAPASPAEATAAGGAVYRGWLTRDNVPLSEIGRRWIAGVERFCATTSVDAVAALVRAMGEAGLETGVVGVDDERLINWLPEAGLAKLDVRYARETFNDIRLVKTPAEIELLARAATINQDAVVAAMAAAREGAGWDELRRVYMQRMAHEGGRGVYLACGVGGLPHGEIVAGEPVMFDGLGTYRQYHGDFGRSLVVGEPSDELVKRVQALQTGWETARDMIRPGASYSAVASAAQQAVIAAGFDGEFRLPVPHSLGLEHTDDPRSLRLPVGAKPDRVLEENMVLNVDMPHTEIGWGSIHLEDTVRVTANGCATLTNWPTELRVVAAPR